MTAPHPQRMVYTKPDGLAGEGKVTMDEMRDAFSEDVKRLHA